jgi:hypothetical protein
VNRPTLALVIALLFAGTLAFPSAAAPLPDGPTDQLGENVSLTPSSDYAYLDADNELVVDVSPSNPALEAEGVNPDSVTSFDDVFRVRYEGSGAAHVWVRHDAEAVTFTVDGRPVGSEANNVTLGPNESVGLSMTVDTTAAGVDDVVGDISVDTKVAEGPSRAEGSSRAGTKADAEPDDTTIRATRSVARTADSRSFTALATEPGERVAFDAGNLQLDRVGDQTLTFDGLSVSSGERSFALTAAVADGGQGRSTVADAGAETLGAVRVTRDAGNVTGAILRFSVSSAYFEARGVDPANLTVYRYTDGSISPLPLTMTDERDGRVTFAAETPGFSTFVVAVDRPRFSIDAGLDATTVASGEAVTVTTTVSNTGTLDGDRTVSVAVDGAVVAERTVTVPAGESRTVDVPVVREGTGTYSVTVDGVEAGSVEVVSATTATPTPSEDGSDTSTPTTDRGTPGPVEEPSGFGLRSLLGLVGLLIVVAATLSLARRTPRP